MNTALPQNLWPFLRHFLKAYKGVVVLYTVLAICAGFWGPFNSWLIKYIINLLSSTSTINISLLVFPAVLLVLNFIAFDNITWRAIGYLNYKFQVVIKNKIISETFSFVLQHSHQFFQDNLAGRIANQVTTLADSIERILHKIVFDFIRGASVLIVGFVSMYYVNPSFFWTLALWFLIFFSLSVRLSRHLVSLSDRYAAAEATSSGQLVDSITNMSSVRIFARETYEIDRLQKYLLVTQEKFRKKEFFLVLLHFIQGMLIAVMLAVMLYFLIQLRGRNLITIGDFALILGLSIEVGHTAWHTVNQLDEFFDAVGRCKQSLSCLFVPLDIQDREGAPDLLVKNGEITFSGVEFHYKNTDLLFQNKSVTIKAGQKVGLVGYSGSGKSTFVNLILRLYDVTKGQILIDGQDIAQVTQDSLRSNIAMIPQDPSLFHRSLMENIRYGRLNATNEDVIESSKRAHTHEFISKLPQGYESLVGERGVKLSGGQRQRISMARAMLKNVHILILDEATSQLDSVTEKEIQESLEILMQGKTTIVIAHRLSTLLHMDRIIVFDQGKIVEDGTHDELLAKNGLYKTLWDAQVGGFLPDKK